MDSRPLTDAEIAELRKSATEPFYDSFADTPHAALALRLLDEVTRSRALLSRIEWSATVDYLEHSGCPECLGMEPGESRDGDKQGHEPDCELAALIGKAQ